MDTSKMLKVAVSGVGGGGGQSICKALMQSHLPIAIVPVDISGLSAGLHRTKTGGFVLPKPEDDIEAWYDFVVDNAIVAIFPGSDHDLMPLSQHAEHFRMVLGCEVMVANPFCVETANQKFKTFLELYSRNVPVPETYCREDNLDAFVAVYGFPLVVKPSFGMTSRGVQVVQDEEEMRFFWRRTHNPIVQEYIEGDEYTTTITFDKDSVARAVFVLKRSLYAGTTYVAESGSFPLVEQFCWDFAEKVKDMKWTHALNIQLRVRDGVCFVIELNSRCSGSTAIRAHFNFNQPSQLLEHYVLGKPIVQPETTHGVAFRYWDELFLKDVTMDEVKALKRGMRGSIPSLL